MASVKRTIKRNGAQIKRAIAYARFSSNNQREESISAQLRAIREYCDGQGIKLVDIYTDEAQTATNDNRDNFQVMMKKVMKGYYDIDAVIVHKFNRFARNKYDSALYKKRLREIGIKVISVTQPIDDSPEGRILESMIEAMDEYYSENLALEVQKGMRENALAGKSTGGGRVLGLSVDENGYYFPNEQAPIVKRIFTEFVGGVPKTKICERLNKEGYRNQYGRKFNTRTLDGILQNEKYVGTYVYNITHAETIRLEGVIQNPIIDENLWIKAQEKKRENNKPRYRAKARFYFMSGKIRCGVCGSTYCGSGSKKSGRGNKVNAYYCCSGKTKQKNGCTNGSLNKEYYENKISDKLIETILTDDFIKVISNDVFVKLETDKKEPQVPTEKLKRQLADIKSKQSKLMDLYIASKLDKDMLDEKSQELTDEKRLIEQQIAKNEVMAESSSIQIEEIEKYIKSLIRNLYSSDSTKEEIAQILFHTFVDEVVVYVNHIEIKIKADFSAFEGDNSIIGRAIVSIAPAHLQSTIARRTVNKNNK